MDELLDDDDDDDDPCRPTVGREDDDAEDIEEDDDDDVAAAFLEGAAVASNRVISSPPRKGVEIHRALLASTLGFCRRPTSTLDSRVASWGNFSPACSSDVRHDMDDSLIRLTPLPTPSPTLLLLLLLLLLLADAVIASLAIRLYANPALL